MNLNIKKIVTVACMAAFLATSFLPGITEAANGRMSLAQAQQEIKRPMHQKYPHYKQKHTHKVSPHHRFKSSHHGSKQHRHAMHTLGPVSRTWVPVRNAPPHHMKKHSSSSFKKHGKHPMPPIKYHKPKTRK